MNVKKAKILVVLIIIIFILFAAIFIFKVPSKIINNLNEKDKDLISTDSIYYAEKNNVLKMAKDYTNPTEAEKAAIYDYYGGTDVCYFSDQGLVIMPGEYNERTEKLITNIWPDTDNTKNVLKPEFGEIYYLEDTDESLYFILINYKDKDLNDYIDKVKENYNENKNTDKKNGLIYYGENVFAKKFQVNYNKENDYVIITYTF